MGEATGRQPGTLRIRAVGRNRGRAPTSFGNPFRLVTVSGVAPIAYVLPVHMVGVTFQKSFIGFYVLLVILDFFVVFVEGLTV